MSRRTARRRSPWTGTVLPGSLLVIALVVALPVTWALCPADALGLDGAGTGAGDVVAAALSGLDRDLHGARLLPAPRLDPVPLPPEVAAPVRSTEGFGRASGAVPPSDPDVPRPADALAGPGADGHPFLD